MGFFSGVKKAVKKVTHAVTKVAKHGLDIRHAGRDAYRDVKKAVGIQDVTEEDKTTSTPYSDNLTSSAGERVSTSRGATNNTEQSTKKRRTNKSSLKIDSSTGLNVGGR